MLRIRLLPLSAVLAALAVAPAQGRSTPQRPPDIQSISSACCLVAGANGLVAEGNAYRAQLSRNGVQFVPALGKRAPELKTLQLQLVSIRRGDDPARTQLPSVEPRGNGLVATYERGVAREQFQVQPEGLALSLHFDAPLPGTGDLVVRYAIDTDLSTVVHDADGLHFHAGALGGVRIGEVTGVAADGDTTPGSLLYVDGQLELRLPNEFVTKAAYPVVLDPLIAPDVPVTTGLDSFIDLAFDASYQRYLVVWSREFALNQTLIRGCLVNASGTPVSNLLLVRDAPIGQPVICLRPSVGNVAMRDRFFVAWQESSSFGSAAVIGGVAVNAIDGSVSGVMTVAAPPGLSAIAPRVAGENGSDDDALVVWIEVGSGVRGATVALGANGVPAVDSLTNIATTAGVHTGTRVMISRSQDSASRYVVAWNEGPQLRACAYDRNLQNPSNLLATNLLPSGHVWWGIDLDGDGSRFVVAWSQQPFGMLNIDTFALPLQLTGNTLALAGPIRTLENATNIQTAEPRVAFLGNKFTLAWTRFQGIDYTVEGIEVGFECADCGTPWTVPATNNEQLGVALATRRAGGGTSEFGLCCYSDIVAQPPALGRISAVPFRASGAGIAPTAAGAGCGTAGTISVAGGPFVLGNPNFRIVLNNAPASGLTFVNLAVGANPPLLQCGVCSVLAGGVITYVQGTGGSVEYPLAVPCQAGLLGFTMQAQWLVLGAPNSPCPLLPNAAATGRLQLLLSE